MSCDVLHGTPSKSSPSVPSACSNSTRHRLAAQCMDGRQCGKQAYTWRIDHLCQTARRLKFLSLEPLLGPISQLNLREINWLIVGGESGPGAQPLDEAWVLQIRDQCQAVRVPFFFKQWGGVWKKRTGRLLEGCTWMPCHYPSEYKRGVRRPRREYPLSGRSRGQNHCEFTTANSPRQ